VIEDRDDLTTYPKGWLATTLGNIINPYDEKVEPSILQEVPYVGLEHIAKNTGKLLGFGNSSEVRSTKSKFYPGDLLYGKLRPYLNKVHCVNFEGVCSTDILVFPRQPYISNEFLSYRFLCKDFVSYASHNVNGVQHPRVNFQSLSKFPIHLPPLNEQRRIVEKIEALKARSQRVKEALEDIPQLLDQFRQSVLAAAFRGDLTADWRSDIEQNSIENISSLPVAPPIVIGEVEAYTPQTWSWVSLIDVATLESGHTPRKSVPEYWEGGNVPWICLQDIRAAHGKIIYETLYMPTMLGIDNSSARLLPEGTVCFSRDISVGFVTIMGRSMATTQHFANWICGSKLFNKYLMYAFMAASSSLIQSGEGTTVRTLYMPALKRIQILLPPIEEQKEIVHQIESLYKAVDIIEQQYQEIQANLDQLDQSILAKAFRGKLVPQDPNDEPASVLLERIRAERAELQTKTVKKSTTKTSTRGSKKTQRQ